MQFSRWSHSLLPGVPPHDTEHCQHLSPSQGLHGPCLPQLTGASCFTEDGELLSQLLLAGELREEGFLSPDIHSGARGPTARLDFVSSVLPCWWGSELPPSPPHQHHCGRAAPDYGAHCVGHLTTLFLLFFLSLLEKGYNSLPS